MPRFDLLDEYARVIIPGGPHNGSRVGIAHRDEPSDGQGFEPDPGLWWSRGQNIYDAIISGATCLCWISW